MPIPNAIYEIVTQNGHCLILADTNEGQSVIQNAVQVIAVLDDSLTGGIGDRRVFYRSPTGEISELQVSLGRFAGSTLCAHHQQESLAKTIDSTRNNAWVRSDKTSHQEAQQALINALAGEVRHYRKLHDYLSDMIEETQTIRPDNVADHEYRELVELLVDAGAFNRATAQAQKQASNATTSSTRRPLLSNAIQ